MLRFVYRIILKPYIPTNANNTTVVPIDNLGILRELHRYRINKIIVVNIVLYHTLFRILMNFGYFK